jgi:hypothetical protein
LATAFSLDQDKWFFLTNNLQSTPTFFWGYSLADASTLQAISQDTIKGRSHQDKWICMRENDEAAARYFRALGFHIVIAETSEVLDYLATICSPKASAESLPSSVSLYPEYLIPSVGTVPVRPIADFYLGAAPSWSDIYSNSIFRTSHFNEAINNINSGRHLVILGIPACGKTTLMMQLAASHSFNGSKLICDTLTSEKAITILKNLAGEKAIVFLDNCSDSIDAMNLLIGNSNVQIVGFDRDHNYAMASHKVKGNPKIVGVTNLTPSDQQSIYSSIPSHLRRPMMIRPQIEAGLKPSVYELLQANILTPKLNARYREVLRRLEAQETVTHDYLAMCSYVHSCHTPVSFDMALAFLRGDIENHSGVYEMTNKVFSLVPDYSGDLADSTQDYFMPRSVFVSEAILDQVSQISLQRMLNRFHKNVSPFRICHFDIFKRRAFSADVAKKAFPKCEDGIAYYERLHKRDKNYYLLQQAALYCSYKKQHSEAFRLIDKAISEAGPSVFAIKNSHAIILFEANIDHASTSGDAVRRELDRSLSLLTECHNHDFRKQYHALKFADLALQYWDIYGDNKAESYLRTANSWLEIEQKVASWNRNLVRLIDRISRKLNI